MSSLRFVFRETALRRNDQAGHPFSMALGVWAVRWHEWRLVGKVMITYVSRLRVVH